MDNALARRAAALEARLATLDLSLERIESKVVELASNDKEVVSKQHGSEDPNANTTHANANVNANVNANASASANTNVSRAKASRTRLASPGLGWMLSPNCVFMPGRGAVWVSAPARVASYGAAPNQRRLCWPVPNVANRDTATPRFATAGHAGVLSARQVERKPPPGLLGGGCAPGELEVGESVAAAALLVLSTPDPMLKAQLTLEAVRRWQDQEIPLGFGGASAPDQERVPARPARPESVRTVPMSRVKQGGRKAMIHSVAHAESFAIDLMWDIVLRFGSLHGFEGAGKGPRRSSASTDLPALPLDFFNDWIRIAGDEARHFMSWEKRLRDMGSYYGDLPGHDGLWDAAEQTSHSLCERLALVHMVHEARGLDVVRVQLAKLDRAGDTESAATMERNHRDEITHVAAGVRWYEWLCAKQGCDPIQAWHALLKEKFGGTLLGPFNNEARAEAGMNTKYYQPFVDAE